MLSDVSVLGAGAVGVGERWDERDERDRERLLTSFSNCEISERRSAMSAAVANSGARGVGRASGRHVLTRQQQKQ